MCGIAGLLGVPKELASIAAVRMLATMRQRGPDDENIVTLPDPQGRAHPAVLLHTRLAIQDLSTEGRQPMPDRPQGAASLPNWIVFNGEVFNFRDLRDELSGLGRAHRTRCDTEVILHAYRQWGEDCVDRMRGMFAWCLLDSRAGEAWFCRDRLGIKPLYLARTPGGGLVFASELRTVLAAGPHLVPPQVNPAALESFLAQGAVYGLDSIVSGVRLLGPGESLRTDWSGITIQNRTYWNIPFARVNQDQGDGPNEREAAEQLAETMRDSVRQRLIADAPLGLFLSGGVDSGALATLATEVSDSQVESVSLGFDQPEYDETQAASTVARLTGTRHHSVTLTGQDVLAGLPDVLASMDQPTVDGFNVFFVSRAARSIGLKAALSGLGGDELFGGYASFHDVPRAVRWRRWLSWARCPARLAFSRLRTRSAAKAREMLSRQPSAVQMYLLRRELFLREERREFLEQPPDSDPYSGLSNQLVHELTQGSIGLDPFNQVSYFELTGYMRHMLLRDADVFSMSQGLELRVPLLDHVLVEQTAALQGACKRAGSCPKAMLINAVGRRLPQLTYTQPKRGFTFPWDVWIRGALKQRTERAIANADVWRALGMNPSAAQSLWQRFLLGDRRVAALQLLALIVLEDFATRHGLRCDSAGSQQTLLRRAA